MLNLTSKSCYVFSTHPNDNPHIQCYNALTFYPITVKYNLLRCK